MIICNVERARAFKKRSRRELRYDNHWKKKAEMNTKLFSKSLRRLNQLISRKERRKLLLLVSNCSALGKRYNVQTFSHIRATLLPSNISSKIHPLDAGIIAKVNNKYRRRLLLRVFDNTNIGLKSIYNVGFLTTLRWVTEKWNIFPSTVIKNCFNHCLKASIEIEEEDRRAGNKTVL